MPKEKFYRSIGTYNVLLVASSLAAANQYRYILRSMGFHNVLVLQSHRAAVQEQASRKNISHVLFETKNCDMPVNAFMESLLEQNAGVVMIPITDVPHIEYIFDLLRAGARGVLVPPLALPAVEEMIIMATSSEPGRILEECRNRNVIFTEIILNNLYHLALAKKHAKNAASFLEYVHKWQSSLHDAVNLAVSYCEDGTDALRDAIMAACINRAEGTLTRLGPLRRELGLERQRRISAAEVA